jgi:hypothetical protein
MIVRIAAFVVFFCVYKERDTGLWGVLLGEWPTIQRKVICFDTFVSYSAS